MRANATLAGWLGYARSDMVGLRLTDLLSIGTRMLWETHLAPLLRLQGAFETMALDLVAADGSRVAAFASAVRRAGETDGVVAELALLRGADRRLFERSLIDARNASRERLQQEQSVSELREQFIAVLGHDLRNPLTAIGSGTQLLAKEELSARGRRILGLMGGSVTRMAGLIDDILDFARGRLGGGLALEQEAAALGPMLQQVVDELRAGSPGRLIEVDIAVSGLVMCDVKRIGQLVSNLVGNAITHGAQDVPVRVWAGVSDEPPTGETLTISICNGGSPIPETQLDKLFQPFFRGEARASAQGLGLGLHIASETARAHGGTLTATSTATKTCFTFRMPLTGPDGGG